MLHASGHGPRNGTIFATGCESNDACMCELGWPILLPAGPDTNINGNGKKMIKSIVSSDWVPPCHFIE